MASVIGIDEIQKILPHRYPFLLIDKVLEWAPYETIWAQKNVTINEPFFPGHFPNMPIMPGVLIVESLAQAAGILSYLSDKKTAADYLLYLAAVDNVRFKKPVKPGDVLDLKIHFLSRRGGFVKVRGEAFVAETLVCSADMISAEGS